MRGKSLDGDGGGNAASTFDLLCLLKRKRGKNPKIMSRDDV
jgi:hypothetical protein